jgi:hypothetical protein
MDGLVVPSLLQKWDVAELDDLGTAFSFMR